MNLASYITPDGTPRTGVLVDTPDGPRLADLAGGLAELEHGDTAARLPNDMRELIALGTTAMDDAQRVHAHVIEVATSPDGRARLATGGVLADIDEVTFLPVVPRPGKMICAGKNYADHVAEAAETRPERPAAFVKFSSSLIGHRQPISYPAETKQLDYEGELALVIGRAASRVNRTEALDYVAGYTILNDVSSRDVQFAEMEEGMLLLGKNAGHCSPLGPWLVTADEVDDPHDIGVEVTVNGEIRQSGSTRDLIFGCDELIAYWSAAGLEPGDVIATGTPAGVGIFRDPPERYLLGPGDIVEVTLSGLGTLRNQIAG